MLPLKQRLVLATAMAIAAIATLSACATSAERRTRAIAPDPVIETRIERITVCPAELDQAIPTRVTMPDGARLEAAEAVLRWIAARFARETLLEARLTDAKAACPQ